MWYGIKRSPREALPFVHAEWASDISVDGWPAYFTQDINLAHNYCDFLRNQWPTVGYYVAEKTD